MHQGLASTFGPGFQHGASNGLNASAIHSETLPPRFLIPSVVMSVIPAPVGLPLGTRPDAIWVPPPNVRHTVISSPFSPSGGLTLPRPITAKPHASFGSSV